MKHKQSARQIAIEKLVNMPISTRDDVEFFFNGLIELLGTQFHPGTRFEDYVDMSGEVGCAVFGCAEAIFLNEQMELCFNVAGKERFRIHDMLLLEERLTEEA